MWSTASKPGLKALANEDTLLATYCCRHTCFPVCPREYKFCVRDTRNVSDFVQKHFVSATNVSQFAQPKKRHGQQSVRNNVSSFTRAFRIARLEAETWMFTCNTWIQKIKLFGVTPFSLEGCEKASGKLWSIQIFKFEHLLHACLCF